MVIKNKNINEDAELVGWSIASNEEDEINSDVVWRYQGNVEDDNGHEVIFSEELVKEVCRQFDWEYNKEESR